MSNQTTWLIIAGIIAITTIAGLDVLFLMADVTLQQPLVLVEDSDPCRLITCGVAKIRAEAVGTNPLTGNTICKCPNRAEYYGPLYQVSAKRKY